MDFKLSKYCLAVNKSEECIVLFNAITGGVIKLELEIYNTICEGTFSKNVPFFDKLKKELYIVPASRNEFKFLKYNEILTRQSVYNNNLYYVIAPTLACNLHCGYCFENGKRNADKISKTIIERITEFIFEQAKKLKTISNVHVLWFGGEPMLCYKEILELGSIAKEKLKSLNVKLSSSMITNGILFDKSRMLRLKENCNLRSVQITLDGLSNTYCKRKQALPSDFEKVIQNIIEVCKDIEVQVRLNVDKNNINEIYELADLIFSMAPIENKLELYLGRLCDYGYNIDGINYFSTDEFNKAQREFFSYLIQKNYCNRPYLYSSPCHKTIYCELARANNFAIDKYGRLYKCEHYLEQNENCVGDVENGLYYNEPFFDDLLGISDDLCETCNLYPICHSNCPISHALIKRHGDSCERYSYLLTQVNNYVSINIANKS